MKVAVVSVHPDDEVIGAGGTLLKHLHQGDEVYWIIITNLFEHQGFTMHRIAERQSEIETVADRFGFKKTFKLDYPTMTLSGETVIGMVPRLATIFSEIKPEVLYCVNRSDAHSDHRVAFDAVMACTKSFRYPFIKKVLMYECISETEFAPALHENVFIPNYFVDVTDFFQRKLEILNIYKSEVAQHPFPRSKENVNALAIFRGAIAGVRYAEAFQLIKYIDK